MVKNYKLGLICSIASSAVWGLLTIYWHQLQGINSMVTVLYRILMSAVCCIIIAVCKYGVKDAFAPVKDRKIAIRYCISGIIITMNWSIYIWAVVSGHVIDTTVGYYIEPLMVCAFGAIIFKEKLNKYSSLALVIIVIGVLAVIAFFGKFPYIALGAALTFAIYSAVKKGYPMPPLKSLILETVFIAPIVLAIIIYLEFTGNAAIGIATPWELFLLICTGPITVLPLILFAVGVNNIDLFTNGLVAYINPTISLMVGIFVFKDPFEPIQLIAFAIIWIGLIVYSIGEYKRVKGELD